MVRASRGHGDRSVENQISGDVQYTKQFADRGNERDPDGDGQVSVEYDECRARIPLGTEECGLHERSQRNVHPALDHVLVDPEIAAVDSQGRRRDSRLRGYRREFFEDLANRKDRIVRLAEKTLDFGDVRGFVSTKRRLHRFYGCSVGARIGLIDYDFLYTTSIRPVQGGNTNNLSTNCKV